MNVPKATHLQFFILDQLRDGERSGHEIRQALFEIGDRRSLPSFYQLMARLEEKRWVTGRYQAATEGGQIFRERRYEITSGGEGIREEVRRFYGHWFNPGRRVLVDPAP